MNFQRYEFPRICQRMIIIFFRFKIWKRKFRFSPAFCAISIYYNSKVHNLVPRLFPLVEQRPRSGLVTWPIKIRLPQGVWVKYHITCFHFSIMFNYIAFLSCLEFALLNSVYKGIILKPKQVLCLESAYLEKDVMCVLPTGYGKSLIFHLLPMLIFAKYKLRMQWCPSWLEIESYLYCG